MNKVCGVVERRGAWGRSPRRRGRTQRSADVGEGFPLLKHTSKILPAAARAASAKSSATASEAAA